MRLALLVLTALPLAISEVAAQSCLGQRGIDRSLAVSGLAAFAQRVESYGASVGFDLAGPIGLSASLSQERYEGFTDDGSSGIVASARVGYEIPVQQVSICPVLGASLRQFDVEIALGDGRGGVGDIIEEPVRQTVVPVSLGVGKQFALRSELVFVPFAELGLLHMRAHWAEQNLPGWSDTGAFGSVGTTVGWKRVFVQTGVSLSTLEESEPVFQFGLGIVRRQADTR